MSNYVNNDDDLFDYDPEEDQSSPVSYNIEDAPKSEFFDNIKDHLDHDLEATGNIDTGKFRLASSYQIALHNFVNDTKSEASAKTISIVLNTLTNNDFSLMLMFYETEMRISRRMLFLEISYRAFDKEDEDTVLSLHKIGKILNIEFSELYINTCFQSTWNITEHALKIDRALYLSLSERLGIPVKQYLFEDVLGANDSPHDVYLVDYNKDMNSMLTSIIMEGSFIEKLQELTGGNVALLRANEKDI
jgi:hypothetical protein